MGHLSDSGVDAFGGHQPGPGSGFHVPQLGEVVARQMQVLVGAERALERRLQPVAAGPRVDVPQLPAVHARPGDHAARLRVERVQVGEEALAAWAKENLARAKQTLPNGSCGLPLQQTCPHPNACLTCDHFLTTPEFLTVHREQLGRTRELLATARERGQQRLIDMNEPIELNLVRIDGLQRLTNEQPADAA
jgi:hypothetical protein